MFQEEAVTILREQLELWSTTAQVSQRELEKEQLTSSKLCEEVAALRQECQEAGTSRAVEINELRAKNLRELSASLHELQERNERLRVLQLKNDALEQTVATERTRYEVQLERTEARNLEEINKMQANNLKELAASLHKLQDRNERLRELHLKNAELEAELTREKRSKAEALERSPEERKTPRREEQRSGSVRQFPSLGCMPTGPAPDYPGTHEISAPPSAVASIHSRRAHAARRTPHAARRRARSTPHAAARTPHAAARTPHARRTHGCECGCGCRCVCVWNALRLGPRFNLFHPLEDVSRCDWLPCVTACGLHVVLHPRLIWVVVRLTIIQWGEVSVVLHPRLVIRWGEVCGCWNLLGA